MDPTIVRIAALAGWVLFIVALKLMARVPTASRGNLLGMIGMALAIASTLVGVKNWTPVLIGLASGTAVGLWLAWSTPMTGMPQMVALLNGFGGAASALVAAGELTRAAEPAALLGLISATAGGLVGSVTFTGSVVAFAKLQELLPGRPILFRGQHAINLVLGLAALGLCTATVVDPANLLFFWGVLFLSSILGILLVIPIGGADMPVVISLLNSYSGIAAAATGFAIRNDALIISGSLVGASGIILTNLMCKAMNRSLLNVLFGGVGVEVAGPAGAAGGDGQMAVRQLSIEDAPALFDGARLAIIVPGYGMAVAQAQHAVKELGEVLRSKGVTVKYAIHPVAGRMPGHMNVLLAEAQVPYEDLYEMDVINPEFGECDVAIVVGANDITNPAARTRKDSPLYGMPILEVDRARTVIFCKRGMGKGFAGVDNELFANPKTLMLFGDAKKTISELALALKRG